MELTDLAKANELDFAYIKAKLDARTGEAIVYDDVVLPHGTSPPTVDLYIWKKQNGSYAMQLSQEVYYDGPSRRIFELACCGEIGFPEWVNFKTFCLQINGDPGDGSPAVDTALPDIKPQESDITDWSVIRLPGSRHEGSIFNRLYAELKKKIMGQDFPVATVAYQVAQFLRRKHSTKPVSIMMAGPPGTGKSELAKSLAAAIKAVTGEEYHVVWVDLNTFPERHSNYRLIGSPPSYIGYNDPPIFACVKGNPKTIFIFDELDKAHSEVIKTFMAVLDEGRCAANDGTFYDFKNCILFFTSNYDLSGSGGTTKRRIGFQINQSDESKEVKVTFDENNEEDRKALPQKIYQTTEMARRAFITSGNLPEIASRFQAFCIFNQLSEEAKVRILSKQIVEAGLEYDVRITWIAPAIIQGLTDVAASADSLTVRSYRGIVESYLADCFAFTETEEGRKYRLDGDIYHPLLSEN